MKAEEIVRKYNPEIVTRNGVEGIIPNQEKGNWQKNMEIIKIAKPEIMKILREKTKERQERKKQEELKEKEILEKDIETGKAFLVLQIPQQYDNEITYARRFTEEEKKNYADWFQDRGFVRYSASENIKIINEVAFDFAKNRKSDGSFCGCTNEVYIITAEESEQLQQQENNIKIKKEEKEKQERAAIDAIFEKAKTENKKQILDTYVTGTCFNPNEDCSFDTVTKYALPNGKTEVQRQHCW